MVLLPKAEAPNLLTVQRKTKNVSEGTWARVKGGIYKGDLAQVQFLLLIYVSTAASRLRKAT